MGKMPMFDVPPLPNPGDEDQSEADEAATTIEDPCGHSNLVLVEKLEHKFRQDAVQTAYTHKCVGCGMVVTV